MLTKIPYDNKTRIETGPIQFGDDWPGLFIRGDNALMYSLDIEMILEQFKTLPEENRNVFAEFNLEGLMKLLRSVRQQKFD